MSKNHFPIRAAVLAVAVVVTPMAHAAVTMPSSGKGSTLYYHLGVAMQPPGHRTRPACVCTSDWVVVAVLTTPAANSMSRPPCRTRLTASRISTMW